MYRNNERGRPYTNLHLEKRKEQALYTSAPHHMTSHTTLHHTTPHHIISQHATPHHNTPHHTRIDHATPHHTTPHQNTTHHTTTHHTTPHQHGFQKQATHNNTWSRLFTAEVSLRFENTLTWASRSLPSSTSLENYHLPSMSQSSSINDCMAKHHSDTI